MPVTQPRPEQHSGKAPEGARLFEWHPCPEHPRLVISVVAVRGSPPWCIGDGATIPGHWVELEQAA